MATNISLLTCLLILALLGISQAEDFCNAYVDWYTRCDPNNFNQCVKVLSHRTTDECTDLWYTECDDSANQPVLVTNIPEDHYSACGVTSNRLYQLSGAITCHLAECVGSPSTDDCGLNAAIPPFDFYINYSFEPPDDCGSDGSSSDGIEMVMVYVIVALSAAATVF